MRPLVTAIKRHSLEDGPGIRSVVFFKGCPLHCVFCHSPETQSPVAEIAIDIDHCVTCGRCESACPQGAIDLAQRTRIDRHRCQTCGCCAEVCPDKGLRLIGRAYPIEELGEILLRDLPFYRHSRGGVTLSGGECTLFPDYVGRLARLLKSRGVHICLQTSGYFDFEAVSQQILPFVDLIHFDIKLMDSQQHQRLIGGSADVICTNFRLLHAFRGIAVLPRIPLIPGITATRENLTAAVAFLRSVGAREVVLLPYNPLGHQMSASLGRPKPPFPSTFMAPAEEEAIHKLFTSLLREQDGEDARCCQ